MVPRDRLGLRDQPDRPDLRASPALARHSVRQLLSASTGEVRVRSVRPSPPVPPGASSSVAAFSRARSTTSFSPPDAQAERRTVFAENFFDGTNTIQAQAICASGHGAAAAGAATTNVTAFDE